MITIILFAAVISTFVWHTKIENYWRACVSSMVTTAIVWWGLDALFYGSLVDQGVLLSIVPIAIAAFLVALLLGGLARKIKKWARNAFSSNG